MPQSLSPLARPGERQLAFIRSFHLYHNWPINETAKFRRERAANARNSIALAHLYSASLHCRGRRVVPHRSATASLQGSLRAPWATAAQIRWAPPADEL